MTSRLLLLLVVFALLAPLGSSSAQNCDVSNVNDCGIVGTTEVRIVIGGSAV